MSSVYATLHDSTGAVIAQAHTYCAGSFHFNWNAFFDITLVLKGSIRLHTQEGIFDVSENMFAIINPNIGHAALTQEEDTIVLVLTISEEYIRKACGYLPAFASCTPDRIDTPVSQLVRASIASFFLSLSEAPEGPGNTLFAKAQIDLMLSVFLKYFLCEKQPEKDSYVSLKQQQRIKTLIDYIDLHFREELTLAALAEYAGMNASYLSSYFRSNTGLSFHEYLMRQRLAHAVYLLGHTEKPILDIALESGFSDSKPFYTAFQKYLKLSPGKYRQALQAQGGVKQIGGSTVLPADHQEVQRILHQFVDRPVLLIPSP